MLKYHCVRIFFTAENHVPDFNLVDYGIGFHYLDFGDRYIRYPLYFVDGFIAYKGDDYASDLKKAQEKHLNAEDEMTGKTDFCSFVYSNAPAIKCRELIFDALSKYKNVSSGGRFRNNVGGPIDNKLEFQKRHKFAIAFENTSTPGYTTEKIVGAFAAGTVPIYWGNPLISKEFNSDSFINCHDYGLTEAGEPGAIEAIVKAVEEIDRNDERYLKMLSTRAFASDSYVAEQNKKFEDFLFNIFDQPLATAYRRNRFYWGERYERKQRIGSVFYFQCRKLIPIRDFFRKIVRWNR